jgi:drug/metabolite transporter (DMT)-like permease
VVAEQWVPSGLAAVVIATTPFWMVGVEAMLPGGERLRATHALGLAIGFLGILVLVGPEIARGTGGGWRVAAGFLALQISCAGWSVGSAYGRRRTGHVAPVPAAALQMLFGGALMLATGTLLGEWPRLRVTPAGAGAVLYLALAGALAGFVAYLYALRHLPVSFVSLYAYVNPVIAVALGTLLLGEPFHLRMAAGAVAVLAGMAVVSAARSGPGPASPRSDDGR